MRQAIFQKMCTRWGHVYQVLELLDRGLGVLFWHPKFGKGQFPQILTFFDTFFSIDTASNLLLKSFFANIARFGEKLFGERLMIFLHPI